jgi:hypothetical protein
MPQNPSPRLGRPQQTTQQTTQQATQQATQQTTQQATQQTQSEGLHRATIAAPETPKPVFARHETFHPRFGWLKKGFDRAAADPGVFLADDATVRLGVGKNMVRSIRYWCSAFKLLAEDQPTELGYALLGDRGWDPYLEDPASLWLLHWHLLQPPCQATTWHFVFNEVRGSEFTEEQLRNDLLDYSERLPGRTAESSLRKDLSCWLRMYVSQPPARRAKDSEESLDCPFAELGLVQRMGDRQHFAFRVGAKPTLPAAVVVYAALQQARAAGSTARTMPLGQLLYGVNSPGVVFKLDEAALAGAIEQMASQWPALSLAEAAGKLQFGFNVEDPALLAQEILECYYASR